MPTFELTLQRKTDSGYPVIAALTRPGGFLPLRRDVENANMMNLSPYKRRSPGSSTSIA